MMNGSNYHYVAPGWSSRHYLQANPIVDAPEDSISIQLEFYFFKPSLVEETVIVIQLMVP